MDDPGELDLTSEPRAPFLDGERLDVGRRTEARGRQRGIRIYFRCCRVYTRLVPPDRVLNGRAATWRIHCPRCGKLLEVPIE